MKTEMELSDEFLAKDFLHIIPNAMHAIRLEMRRIAQADLTVPQFRILALLTQKKHSTNSDLSEQMGTTPPCTSRMLDSLVKQGIIKRVRSSKDRRQVYLQLTPRGLAKFKAIKNRAQSHFNLEFEKLSPENRSALENGLKVIGEIFGA